MLAISIRESCVSRQNSMFLWVGTS